MNLLGDFESQATENRAASEDFSFDGQGKITII